jgi:hypothetical protein
MRHFRKYGLTAALLLACACESDATGKDATGKVVQTGPPTTLQPLTDIFRYGTVGDSLSHSPTVRVWDANSNPLPNVPVTYTLSEGAGRLSGAPQTTDSIGVAKVSRWVLPTKPGEVTLHVAVANLQPVRFVVNVHAQPAFIAEVLSGNEQAIAAGASTTLRVRMVDSFGNPGPTDVSFTVNEGRATVSAAQVRAGSDGIASVQLTASASLASGEVIRVAVRRPGVPESIPSQVITLRGA